MEPSTTPESKHIFVQVNTDNIITIYESPASNGDVILENTIIYDQGSMALGNPIVDFAIGIESHQDVYFSIIPSKLFTYDKVCFTAFVVEQEQGVHIPDQKWEDGILSFSVNTGAVEPGGFVVFNLVGRIDYKRKTLTKSIDIKIDPVMRVVQR